MMMPLRVNKPRMQLAEVSFKCDDQWRGSHELTQGLTVDQRVVAGGSQPSLEELERQRRLHEIGQVFIKFTKTRRGTDLGIRVDGAACDLSAADFENGTGTVHFRAL
jgi:hypothetical protein